MSLVDVGVGDELPVLVIESIDAEKMKLMAALLRDPNPIHFDVDAVRALGLGDRPVNQGPTNLSYLLETVTRWSGGVSTLVSVDVRFLGNVFAGDRVTCRGVVRAIDPESATIEVDVEATTDAGKVLSGAVTVRR